MSDLLKKIDDATTRLAQLQQERSEREKSANAHEAQAKQDRLAMTELKQEIAQLDAIVRHARVAQSVDVAAQAALQAEASAKAHEEKAAATLVEIEQMKTTLATMLAQAKPKE